MEGQCLPARYLGNLFTFLRCLKLSEVIILIFEVGYRTMNVQISISIWAKVLPQILANWPFHRPKILLQYTWVYELELLELWYNHTFLKFLCNKVLPSLMYIINWKRNFPFLPQPSWLSPPTRTLPCQSGLYSMATVLKRDMLWHGETGKDFNEA